MSYKVLAVDDDPEILEAYRRALEPQTLANRALRQALRIAAPEGEEVSFNLTTASQGQEGLQRFKEAAENGDSFSVVFLDMRMPPGWDGLRTAEEIRKLDPNVFIIFVSAHTDRSLDELRMRLGPSIMMQRKPFSRHDIHQCAYAMAVQRQNALELSRLKRENVGNLRAARHVNGTATENAAALIKVLQDKNTEQVTLFAVRHDKSKSDCLAALAEYCIPSVGALSIVYDGHFLCLETYANYIQMARALDAAEVSGKAFFAEAITQDTGEMTVDEAVSILKSLSQGTPLTKESRAAFFARLSAVGEAAYRESHPTKSAPP
jgi:CheY-like chemotaxis protein